MGMKNTTEIFTQMYTILLNAVEELNVFYFQFLYKTLRNVVSFWLHKNYFPFLHLLWPFTSCRYTIKYDNMS